MELTPAKPVSPTPTPTPTPNPPAPKPMPESVLPEPTPEPIPDDQEQPEKIPVAPASTAKLDSTLNNTLQVGVKNIAYAGKSNKITVIASAKSEFLNELRQKQQVKAYAYIYSDPKLLYSTDGTKHVTVRIDENGTITFNAIVPDEYEGNHTILLIDEQGNQVAWTNVLVKKDEPSQTQDTQDSDENKPNTNENTNTNVHTSESATEKPRVSEHPNSSNTPKEIANPKELETPKELALPKAKPVETEKPNKTSNNTIARTGIQTIPMAICALLMLIAASATFFARQLKK